MFAKLLAYGASYTGALTLGVYKGVSMGDGTDVPPIADLALVGLPLASGVATAAASVVDNGRLSGLEELLGVFDMAINAGAGAVGAGICEGVGMGIGYVASKLT